MCHTERGEGLEELEDSSLQLRMAFGMFAIGG